MKKLSHGRILSLLIITPISLIVELVIGIAIYSTIQNINAEEQRDAKLDLYLRTNTKFISYAESAQRGYLLTGETKFKDSINSDLKEIHKNDEYYDSLPAAVKNRDISHIEKLSDRRIGIILQTTNMYEEGKKDSALAIIKRGEGIRAMDSLRAASMAIRNEFAEQIAQHKRRENLLFSLFLGVIAALFFFNLFLAWYTYRTIVNYAQSLESTVASLSEANEKMSQFTAMSYHELKTPLRNISGFAQLLKRKHSDSGDSEEHEFAEYISDGIRQMNQTINDLRAKYLDDAAVKENERL